MKVGAHPMVVAVALGLLGPMALAEESEERRMEDCATCDGSCAQPCDNEPAVAGEDPLALVTADAWSAMTDAPVTVLDL